MKASPWSKYFCASGLDVATDRVCTPRPAYWITLDLDASSGLVGSPNTALQPTAIGTESAINLWMFLDCMMRPPILFVSSLVSSARQVQANSRLSSTERVGLNKRTIVRSYYMA